MKLSRAIELIESEHKRFQGLAKMCITDGDIAMLKSYSEVAEALDIALQIMREKEQCQKN